MIAKCFCIQQRKPTELQELCTSDYNSIQHDHGAIQSNTQEYSKTLSSQAENSKTLSSQADNSNCLGSDSASVCFKGSTDRITRKRNVNLESSPQLTTTESMQTNNQQQRRWVYMSERILHNNRV